MRRTSKRIAAAVLVGVGGVVLVAAVLAWRATRVPAWYEAARDPSRDVAEAAVNARGLPLQNWLARTSAGDLDAKPDAEKLYTLELTEEQINALLAMAFDNLHGRFERFRVRLTPGRCDVGLLWPEWGRVLGVSAAVLPPEGPGPSPGASPGSSSGPRLGLAGVRVGDQPIPAAWVTGEPARQARVALEQQAARNKRPFRIDAHDVASESTVTAYYGRLLLDLLAGRSVEPLAVLSGRLSSDDLIVTKVTRLDVGQGRLSVTFRMLSPAEREAVLALLATPLPPP